MSKKTNKSIGFLITVRLKSTRLPKKALLDLKGKTVIDRVIDRAIEVVGQDCVVLCTSTNSQDDPLIEIAKKRRIKYFRGSEEDVLKRLLTAATKYEFTDILSITADNALFSVHHSKLLLKYLIKHDEDFITWQDLPFGGFIYGLHVRAIKAACKIKGNFTDTEVWGYHMNRPDIYKVKFLKARGKYNWPDLRITMDYPDDYNFVKHLYEHIPFKKTLSLGSVIDYLKQHPTVRKINATCAQQDINPKIKQNIENYYRLNFQTILKIKRKVFLNDKEHRFKTV